MGAVKLMKRAAWVCAAVAICGAASIPFEPLAAQTKALATNVPIIPHQAVRDFFKNPPGIYPGENMGIATSSKGSIYIYHRANETRLFEYSARGVFLREIGRGNYGFAFAHSVRVDAEDALRLGDVALRDIAGASPSEIVRVVKPDLDTRGRRPPGKAFA